jgi:hypothetical protein
MSKIKGLTASIVASSLNMDVATATGLLRWAAGETCRNQEATLTESRKNVTTDGAGYVLSAGRPTLVFAVDADQLAATIALLLKGAADVAAEESAAYERKLGQAMARQTAEESIRKDEAKRERLRAALAAMGG